MSRSLLTELAYARRRLDGARRRQRAALDVVEIEQRRIHWIEHRLNAGAGHVFTADPDLHMPWRDGEAMCRKCASPVTSLKAKRPCPGDIHICHAEIPERVDGTAFQRYAHDGWFCGNPGTFGSDFATWTCARGHVTTDRHKAETCLPTCPCRFLAGRHSR